MAKKTPDPLGAKANDNARTLKTHVQAARRRPRSTRRI